MQDIINENLSATQKTTAATTISVNRAKNNTEKGFLQLMETSAPSLWPIVVNRTRSVAELLAITNLRPMPDQS